MRTSASSPWSVVGKYPLSSLNSSSACWMFLIWTRVCVRLASSVLPTSLGTTSAASRPRMTMTTMISMSVNPSRRRSRSAGVFRSCISTSLSNDLGDFQQGQQNGDDDARHHESHEQDDQRLQQG